MKQNKKFIYKNTINCAIGTINFAGYHASTNDRMSKMRYLGKYAFAYLIKGEGFYYDELGNNAALTSGDFIMIYPEIGHCYGASAGAPWETIYFVFEGDAFDYLRTKDILKPQSPLFTLKPTAKWKLRLLKLMDDFRKALPNDALPLIFQLQEVIAQAMKHPKGQTANARSRWVSQTTEYIKNHYLEVIDYKELANSFHINYDTFRKYYKNETGSSLTKFQLSLTMEKAAFYLCEENLSVKETSHQLNFCDEFHFSKQFKKTTGMSPRAYKQIMHAN